MFGDRLVAEMAEPPRRTQQERRSTTRAALLGAALDCLREGGLARFTTTDVVARAGLSQGALFRHFPTKAHLLAATSEHLFDTLSADYEQRFRRLPAANRTAPRAVQLLWDSMRDPRLAAAFELYTAARTDAELQAALEPVVRAHVTRLRRLARELLPGAAAQDGEAFDAFLDLAVLALQGLALEELALPDPAARRRVLAALGALAQLSESKEIPTWDTPSPRSTRSRFFS